MADARGDKDTEARLHTALARAEHGTLAVTLDAAHADAQRVMSSLKEH